MATMNEQNPETHITRIAERHGCLFVEGVVKKRGEYLKAAATIMKRDVQHMSKPEFEAFIRRRLPEFTEDVRWEEQVTV